MSANPPHSPDDRQRLNEIEMHLMHLTRTVEALDQVVLLQGRKMDELEREIARLRLLAELARESPEVRRPEDEKPPHY